MKKRTDGLSKSGSNGLERLLQVEPTEWSCRSCHEVYLALAAPPEELICDGCLQELEARSDGRPSPAAAAGIPERFRRGRDLDWWARKFGEMPAAAANWDGKTDLVLFGPTGTGKTGLATILLERELDKGRRGAWISALRFLEELSKSQAAQRSKDPKAGEYTINALSLIDRAERAEVLVFDELFGDIEQQVGSANPYVLSRMHRVIARRYDEMLPTISTTNWQPEKITAALRALGSRLATATMVPLERSDQRLAGEVD